jgi:Protein of unknown function (DUF2474).
MAEPSIVRRLAWFVGLWFAGVVTVGLVAMVIKVWLGA